MIAKATGTDLTVREIIQLYQRNSASENRHGIDARKDREYVFGLFLAWKLDDGRGVGNIRVSDCKPFHLRDFIDAHAGWKSNSTKRAKANAIRAAFQWALQEERTDRNPFLRVRYDSAPPRPCLTDDVLGDLLACSDKRFERAVRFLRLTGCRLSEMCGLTWADVDMDAGLAVIHKHKSRRYTQKPKVIPLTADAIALLREIRRRQPMDYTGVIFVNSRNSAWNRRTLGQNLRRMKKRGEVSTAATLHGLRHQFGTEAIRRGAPLKLVSLALGHASSAITERYYTHIDPASEEVRAAARAAAPALVNQ